MPPGQSRTTHEASGDPRRRRHGRRAAALESSAVGLLRAVNSGQAAYAATCAQGYYAPSLL